VSGVVRDAPTGARRVRDVFAEAWTSASPGPDGAPLVVAVSGGLDSCALLHLCRFTAPTVRLVVAHFDHRMRPGSAGDAHWLRGLAAAWEVDLVTGAARVPPTNEAAAREMRYRFLDEVRRGEGADRVATAHHADDQAETVLFRLARGTGPSGLRGVRTERRSGVWRPLLGVWREDLVDYAREVGLRWREDPTNAEIDFARNAVRHRILPELERLVAPEARRALVRFADLATRDEEGWDSVIPSIVDGLSPEWRQHGGVSLDRAGLVRLHPAVRARVLRSLFDTLGLRAGRVVTDLAVRFTAMADSGRALDVGRGVTLRRDLDRIVLDVSLSPEGAVSAGRMATSTPGPAASSGPGGASVHRGRSLVPLNIPGPQPGSGVVVLAGREVRVAWGDASVDPDGVHIERFAPDALGFPLEVRGWRAGDRIRTRAGERKLKRIFLEARIPRLDRHAWPVVADARGAVLWVPGIVRSISAPAAGGGRALAIRVS